MIVVEKYNLHSANLAAGTNGLLPTNGADQGLRYECNYNEENTVYDFAAVNHQDKNGLQAPVLKLNQGVVLNPTLQTFRTAGNCFSQPYVNFFYGTSDNRTINYHYFDAPIPDPDCVEEPAVVVNVVKFGTPNTELANSCPDRIVIVAEVPPNYNPEILGLEWSPEDKSANEAAYYAAKNDLEEAATTAEQQYLTSQMSEYATNAYLSALAEGAELNSVLLWLERIATFESKVKLAQLYFEMGDLEEAQAQLGTLLNLSEAQQADIAALQSIWEMQTQGLGESLTASNQTSLENLAESDLSYAAAYARNVLSAYGNHYAPILINTEALGERKFESGTTLPITIQKTESLLVYPNPADSYIRIVVSDAMLAYEKELSIYAPTGIKVATLKMDNGQEAIQWNTGTFPSGKYIVRMRVEGFRPVQTSFDISRL